MKQLFIILLYILPANGNAQTIEERVIHSTILKEDRKIWVNIPENYQLRKDSFILVFVLDANNKTLFDYAVASQRFLEHNSVDLSDFNAPESIIVGIDQQEDRYDEFVKKEDIFLDYLTKEVLPYIQKNYRTLNYKILIGHSLGGRFALHALLKQPSTFNAIIAASPAYGIGSLNTIEKSLDSIVQPGLKYDHALFISTTYLPNDNTEEQFREFTEGLRTRFLTKAGSALRIAFDSSKSYGHGKSPFFSIPEGLHFIYDPALWHINYDSAFHGKSYFNLAYCRRYLSGLQNMFGISVSTKRFNNAIIYQLEQDNDSALVQEALLKMVDIDPTDLYIYEKLLMSLYNSHSDKLQAYKIDFIRIMKALNISKEEQEERLSKIEKDKR